MKLDCRRGQGAFTLFEVMVAMVVLVVSLLGLLATLTHAARLDLNSEETLTALRAARTRLELLRAAPFESLPALDGATYPLDAGLPGAIRLVPLPGRSTVSTVQVSPVDPTSPLLLELTVEVRWQGILGSRRVQTRTRRARQ
ncbi:MAG: prepilin-type N-terminal cleavage/methylation domain-containing protein [Planctomycetes bacterium]|nr:prepilin-type N-terminal cleavage/methylation domain-containing protein [Planctomycetota bacterium]